MWNWPDVGSCLELPPPSFTIWKWHLILSLGKFTVCPWWKKSFAPYAAFLLYYVRKLMKAQTLLFLCFGILWWSRLTMHSEVSLRVYKEKRSSSESTSDLQEKRIRWTFSVFSCLILGQASLHLLWGMKCFSLLMIKLKFRLLLVTSMSLGPSLLITRPVNHWNVLRVVDLRGSRHLCITELQVQSYLGTKCDGALTVPGRFLWKVTRRRSHQLLRQGLFQRNGRAPVPGGSLSH